MTTSVDGTQYSLIVPVYRNEETLPALVEALADIAVNLEHGLEVVFVIDGSPDRSYQILKGLLLSAPFPSQLISLSRNFGSFAAIRMGLESGHGPFYAVLAADLQEPPELIIAFFRALGAGSVDITVGTREAREDPFWQSLFGNLFWAIYRKFVQPEVPPGGVDVFGCNKAVRDALIRMRESNSTLIGLLFWLGFRRQNFPYVRRARAAGKSAWTFRRKLGYLADSCFALTDLPITVILATGAIGSVFAMGLSLIVTIAWLSGYVTVAGYTPLILVALNSFTVTMLALGIIGGYVWRSFENTKGRPLYVPMMHETFRGSNWIMSHFVHPNGICESALVGEGTKIWAFAHVLPGARIGQGCNICDCVFIENDVIVGDRVTIKSGVQLWDGLRIEDDVFIGPNATFTNDPFPRSKAWQATIPETRIARGASIGANATILPGVHVGQHAMVGAGSVVTNSVPPFAMVMGNPARITGYVNSATRLPPPIHPGLTRDGEHQVTTTMATGAVIHQLHTVADLRGTLSVAETGQGLPFVPLRAFTIYDVPGKEVRGERALRECALFMICVSGSMSLVLDDGQLREEIVLDQPNIGVYVPPMLWAVQYKFSADAVLLVLASERYHPDDYIRDYEEFVRLKGTRPAG